MAAKKDQKEASTTAQQMTRRGAAQSGPTRLSNLVNPSWPSGHLMVQKDDDAG